MVNTEKGARHGGRRVVVEPSAGATPSIFVLMPADLVDMLLVRITISLISPSFLMILCGRCCAIQAWPLHRINLYILKRRPRH